MGTTQNTADSTSSLPSYVGTVASTTPLIQKPPPKDYAAALATLQSRYGNEGQVPSPKPTPSQKLPASTTTASRSESSSSRSEATKSESTSLMKKIAQSLKNSSMNLTIVQYFNHDLPTEKEHWLTGMSVVTSSICSTAGSVALLFSYDVIWDF